MKRLYISTFISGFDELIKDALLQSFPDVKIDLILDGLVIYRTDASIESIKNLPFFNNSFLLLKLFPPSHSINSLEFLVNLILREDLYRLLTTKIPKKWSTFRVIFSKENQGTAINPKIHQEIEKKIIHSFHLHPNRSKPQLEFWFILRKEGHGMFGMRLTKHQDSSKFLQKGELRPELAYLLCLLSKPDKQDIFLDPFAGSGAIPMARATYFPFTKITALDEDPVLIKKLQIRLPRKNNRVIVSKGNALKLDVEANSVTKVVTDPPWGYFSKQEFNLHAFYSEMLDSFYRAVKQNGIIVLLVGNRELFEQLLSQYQDKFSLIKKYYVLVSGKKAGVYELTTI